MMLLLLADLFRGPREEEEEADTRLELVARQREALAAMEETLAGVEEEAAEAWIL
jgi:hypothetical protein